MSGVETPDIYLTHYLAAFSQVMNIRITYLYRDASNYKYWQDAVFPNRESLSAEELTDRLRPQLYDSQFFDQALAPIPFRQSEIYDQELDHTWLEFGSFEEVAEIARTDEDVLDFIARLGNPVGPKSV